MSVHGVSNSSLLAQLQQQLLGGFVAANSQGTSNSTDQNGLNALFGPSSLFGGTSSDDSTSTSSNPLFGSNSDDQIQSGQTVTIEQISFQQVSFGSGTLSALIQQLEAEGGSGAAATAAGNATDVTGNSTDTTNSTDATGSSASASNSDDSTTTTADPFAVALFDAIDTNGDGTITKSELENAFTTNGGTANSADALYAKITGSSNSDDGISLSQFESSLPQPGQLGGPGGADGAGFGGHHHDFGGGGSGQGFGFNVGYALGSDDSNTLAGGTSNDSASTTESSTTNANGSTTTTITYADGTSISITEPASSGTASASASNSDDSTSSSANNSLDSLNSQFLANLEQFFQNLMTTQNSLYQNNLLGSQLSVSA